MVGGCAASFYKTFIIALAGEGKQANRAYGARKCTPSAACGGVSPRGGDLLSTFLSANLSCTIYSVAKTFPSGGSGAQHQKGCISIERSEVVRFSLPPGSI